MKDKIRILILIYLEFLKIDKNGIKDLKEKRGKKV